MTASAIYNCIPSGKEDETIITYDLYDKASDCTGTQPPGFPLQMIANECAEQVAGSGVYNFIDCSSAITERPTCILICHLWLLLLLLY